MISPFFIRRENKSFEVFQGPPGKFQSQFEVKKKKDFIQILILGSLSKISKRFSVVFFFFNLLIYLFLAVLGLRFCARAFSSCGKWGPLFIAVRGPLTIAASLVAEHRLQTLRLSSCGSRAQLLHGMWDLPRPGSNPCPLHQQADSQPLRHLGSPSKRF